MNSIATAHGSRAPRSPLAAFVCAASLLALVAACGDDSHKNVSGGGASPVPTNASSGAGTGVLVIPTPERLCDPLPQLSEEIGERSLFQAARPLVGGTIKPGTYILHTLETFQGPPAPGTFSSEEEANLAHAPQRTGRTAKVTLYVTSNVLRFHEVRREGPTGSETTTTRGFTYRIDGQKLALTSQCPTRGNATTMAFTASGDWLRLEVDGKSELYTRVP